MKVAPAPRPKSPTARAPPSSSRVKVERALTRMSPPVVTVPLPAICASTWLVTGPGGLVVGVLGLGQLRSVRGDARLTSRVGELATPIEQSPVAYADEQVVDVIQRLGGTSTRALVRDHSTWGSEIVGLLTPEDIARSVELGKLRGSQRGPSASAGGQTDDGRVVP